MRVLGWYRACIRRAGILTPLPELSPACRIKSLTTVTKKTYVLMYLCTWLKFLHRRLMCSGWRGPCNWSTLQSARRRGGRPRPRSPCTPARPPMCHVHGMTVSLQAFSPPLWYMQLNPPLSEGILPFVPEYHNYHMCVGGRRFKRKGCKMKKKQIE